MSGPPPLSRRAALALMAGATLAAAPLAVRAQPNPAQLQPAPQSSPAPDPRLAAAADRVALAHVVTGDAQVDRATAAGLTGLGAALGQRTTIEPGPAIAVDLERDDLTLLTFLYWPVTATQAPPSPRAYLRLNQFMRTGGVILLDTRDGDIAGLAGPDASEALRRLAAPLEVPPLAPLGSDHVLTRSYYLLRQLPGRYQDQPLWLEAPDPAGATTPAARRNDGVSPVIITANAFAEAWAVDDAGLPMFTVGRGYDGERQRELALRAGINIVMYVLTGNYKSDQVHVPALLGRLNGEALDGGGTGTGAETGDSLDWPLPPGGVVP